jgi:ATP-dependent RNA helicase DeaD
VYTHRSGRTGRAGKSGISIAIVNYREKNKIPQIEKNIRKNFERLPVPGGAEICKKQLFKLIDRMEKVEVDEAQIAPFMDTVNKKLEWLSKEQIIKHFVSLEFNRFLEYYKNAPDLNEKSENKQDKRDKRDKWDKHDKRNERGHSDRHGRRGKNGYTRFFINIGKKDDVIPVNIIGMINDNTKDRDINIGVIDIKDSFSFFEVGEKHTAKILTSFHDTKFKGRRVRVDVAEEIKGDRNKGDRKKGKRRKKVTNQSARPYRTPA